jgi:hypothetical protein
MYSVIESLYLVFFFQYYLDSSLKCFCTKEVTKGSVYACQFSEDGGWYRVRVESFGDSGSVSVRYIDYGNTELVPIWRLRPLDGKFLKTAALASDCLMVFYLLMETCIEIVSGVAV